MMRRIENFPKVSVCVITYNHENYIRKCLQSIVDQEVNFDFEVIVGDDGSTDGTRAIVQEFADKYPNMIRAVLHERNVGATKNYLNVHGLARAELVCHCDGDDYWLPKKLKIQVEFMENHPGCNLSGHRMYHIGDSGVLTEDGRGNCDGLRSIMNISAFYEHGNFLPHSSTMYRASNGRVPNVVGETIDYLTNIWRVGDGEIGFIKQYLGVYRRHSASVSEHMSKSLLYFNYSLSALEEIHKIVKDADEFEKRKYALCKRCIKNYIANGCVNLAKEIALESKRFILKKRHVAFLMLMVIFSDIIGLAVRTKRRYLT